MDLLKKTIIVLSATLMLWGCSDDDESTNGDNATISLSTNILQMDSNGGNATITVTSSDDWRLSGVCDWVHPSVTSGKNGDAVIFTIDPNSMDEKRIATFKFFTGSAVVPLQIESQSGYMLNLLSDKELSISKEKSTVKVQLETNIADPVITFSDGSKEWLTFDKRIEFAGKVTLSFIAAENDTYRDRASTITISSPLVAETINVKVNQNRKETIIVENNSFMYDLAPRKLSFEVKYNIDYTISITQGSEWITNQSISEPQTSDDGLSTVTVTYELTEASASRGGKIHIAKTDYTLTYDIDVLQRDPDAKPVVIPDENLRTLCVKNGWILLIEGPQYIVLEAGQKATSLKYDDTFNGILDLTGIENFPNLTSVSLGDCLEMKKLDISGLHNVSELSFSGTYSCEEYNLGDNPVKSMKAGGNDIYSSAENIKVIGSKLESLDISLQSWLGRLDEVVSIDVSECPALTTLNADRGSKVKTLYLKKGQTIPSLTKNEATTIVYK